MHSGRDGEGPVLLRKPKESGRIESSEKEFVSKNIRIAVCLIFAMTGASGMEKGNVAPVLASKPASSLP